MKKFFLIMGVVSLLISLYLPSCKGGEKPSKEGEVKTMYQCPMHPQVIQEKKGECPICGMNLVPRKMIYRGGKWNPYEETEKMEHESMEHKVKTPPFLTEVNIPVERQYLIGIKTEVVKSKTSRKKIRTYGKVDYNEKGIYTINLKFGGWIEKLYLDYEGKFVKRDEKVFEIYSPEAYQAQEELLLAEKMKDSLLFENVKKKLLLWGIRESQIEEILKSKTPNMVISFYSPYSGFVMEKHIFEGMKVEPGMNLYKIADLSRVWILADIYEYELPFVKKDQRAEIEIPYIPGKKFYGTLEYIYPELDMNTRTAKIRISANNPEYDLKPGMYVNVKIEVNLREKEITIPVDAILFSGENNYVFVKKGKGIFEPRIIELGPKVDDGYIVLKGLSEGEEIVTSGNFFIDSESKIQSALKGISLHEH